MIIVYTKLMFVMHIENLHRCTNEYVILGCWQKCGYFLSHMQMTHGLCYSYSRKIVWLELLSTNNDPGVVVLPYLTVVLRNEGITFILEYVHTYMCHVQVVQV